MSLALNCGMVGLNDIFRFDEVFSPAHLPRVLCYFFLIKSNQKSSQSEGFFAALGLALQNGQNPGLETFTPCFAALFLRFSKNFLCPAAARAIIVLPVFGRNCWTDGDCGFKIKDQNEKSFCQPCLFLTLFDNNYS
ncbi:hypothetical protein [Mucilaginibacter sp.]